MITLLITFEFYRGYIWVGDIYHLNLKIAIYIFRRSRTAQMITYCVQKQSDIFVVKAYHCQNFVFILVMHVRVVQ